METQPTKDVQVPVVPPPQTVEGCLASALVPLISSKVKPPFSVPNLLAMLNRLYYFPKLDFVVTTDTVVNVLIAEWDLYDTVTTGESTIFRPYRFTSWHAAFINNDVVLTLYAIKPPLVTGRLGIFYMPLYNKEARNVDGVQRTPLVEWDLSATNSISVTLPGILASETRANGETVLRQEYKTYPVGDYHAMTEFPFSHTSLFESNYGRIAIYLLNSIQIGSLYPNRLRIISFISFKNTRFYSLQAPVSIDSQKLP